MDGVSGAVMCDIAGTELNDEEREWLQDPALGGIILFARNLVSPAQMRALCNDIRAINDQLLIAIDQEGGRVQRLREGVTRLPPMAALGRFWQQDPEAAVVLAHDTGWLLATEMAACGVDFSFAPVLDLDDARCPAIGNRAFSSDPAAVVTLAGAFIDGLSEAGMAAVGKHFPGHGGVTLDSHLTLPEDDRSLAELRARDLVPFEQLAGRLSGIMPAHVRFTAVDTQPAGFSSRWLDMLRALPDFAGAIISDDLSMQGAHVAGDAAARARAALQAGCDLILMCNDAEAAAQARRVIDDSGTLPLQQKHLRRLQLAGTRPPLSKLTDDARLKDIRVRLQQLE
ncbi:beta-N-acetylhexosaminidase [Kushneria phosphatilytica]|uniref:Beta-hexosaminidase n=1 Tax=Kushneria phosphatilytica TaxID=657387 RepID=A0A1S1NU34_9GAMM|nr:beta-N-acetylhexosaminidase [Kushneria phosphatilytica]OHV13064.1 beta-N-acetylhexosaminidase [Kushneria phosphatilytica]QEL10937.1 beta-N-acetylhexosaminidase [Kushneria phosphatilytica]